jgi:DNA primase
MGGITMRQGLLASGTPHARNARGQAMAAPYGVRPWPGATVSTPRSEVRRGLDPGRFTFKTLPARIEKVGISGNWYLGWELA